MNEKIFKRVQITNENKRLCRPRIIERNIEEKTKGGIILDKKVIFEDIKNKKYEKYSTNIKSRTDNLNMNYSSNASTKISNSILTYSSKKQKTTRIDGSSLKKAINMFNRTKSTNMNYNSSKLTRTNNTYLPNCSSSIRTKLRATRIDEVAKQLLHNDGLLEKSGFIKKAVAMFISRQIITSLLLPILAFIILVAPIIAISSIFSNNSFMSEDKDLSQVYLYITELETNMQEEIIKLKKSGGYDAIYVTPTNPIICENKLKYLSYFSIENEEIKYNHELKNKIEELFNELNKIETKVETYSYKDKEGKRHTIKYLYITYVHKDIDDYVDENKIFEGEDLTRYVTLSEQGMFLRQTIVRPFTDYKWQDYISSSYGYRIDPINEKKANHLALDIAVPEGTSIIAGISGEIEKKDDGDSGYGRHVIIKNGDTKLLYGHMSSFENISGEVKAGDVIGRVGSTGRSTGAHLHIEYEVRGTKLNPEFYLER